MAGRYNTRQRTYCHWFVCCFFSVNPCRLQFWTCIQEQCRWGNSLSISTGGRVDIVLILISFVYTARFLSCMLCKNVLFEKKRKKMTSSTINHDTASSFWLIFLRKWLQSCSHFLPPARGFLVWSSQAFAMSYLKITGCHTCLLNGAMHHSMKCESMLWDPISRVLFFSFFF